MKTQKKKTPADYPVLSFRCSREDKEWVGAQLDQLHKKFNAGAGDDDYLINRNDILMGAIKRGLNSLHKVKKISGAE